MLEVILRSNGLKFSVELLENVWVEYDIYNTEEKARDIMSLLRIQFPGKKFRIAKWTKTVLVERT